MTPKDSIPSEAFPATQDTEDDSQAYGIAALILAVVLICVIVVVIIYTYCERRLIPDCCRRYLCPCAKRPRENIQMGYLPANIIVNSGALEQGVPDIFIRNSQSGRISIDPYSYDASRDSQSVTETSGTWAEYLRRATFSRASGLHSGVLADRKRLPVSETDATLKNGSGSRGIPEEHSVASDTNAEASIRPDIESSGHAVVLESSVLPDSDDSRPNATFGCGSSDSKSQEERFIDTNFDVAFNHDSSDHEVLIELSSFPDPDNDVRYDATNNAMEIGI